MEKKQDIDLKKTQRYVYLNSYERQYIRWNSYKAYEKNHLEIWAYYFF
jgi:hypothetical protein